MKPAAILLTLPALLFAACVGAAPNGGDDDPPPRIKEPPTPKGTGSTAAGCEGVTDLGKCDEGIALTCDLDAGALRQKNCKALGKACVMDPQRGAKCDTVPDGAGTDGTCGNIDNDGFCSADGATATWCGTDGQLVVWNCTQQLEGMGGLGGAGWGCVDDKAGGYPGAFCYEPESTPPPPASEQAECQQIKWAGVCDTANDDAVWCSGEGDGYVSPTGTVHTGPMKKHKWDCGEGYSCAVDKCGDGAMCCADEAAPPANACTGTNPVGWEGHCLPNGDVEWCSGQTPQIIDCTGAQVCGDAGGYFDCI
jgi:hypothetical protein